MSEETREQLVDSYNIAPTSEVMIMIEMGKLEPAMWWLVPPGSNSFAPGTLSMFNKKSETLTAPYWKHLLSRQRCILPMSGFYEWLKSTGTPYLIQPNDDTLFWAACLYDIWIDPSTNEARKSFTILTMPANQFMSRVHNRMPVFIAPDDVAKWLDPTYPNPTDLIAPYPDSSMKKYRVTNAVGNAKNDYPGLIQEIPEDPTLF